MKKIYSIALAFGVFGSALGQGINCSTALPITSNGIYNADGPSSGLGAQAICTFAGSNADWYSFTPPCNGNISITSGVDSNLPDTRLSILTGSCGALTCVAADDDSGPSFTSQLSGIAVTGGTTYFIQWDDDWDDASFIWQFTYVSSNPVSAVNVTGVTAVGATVNWTDGSSASWEVEYGLAGFTPGSGTVITAGTTTQALTGLNPETSYDVYVTSLTPGPCNTPVGPINFNTLPLCPVPTAPNVTGLTDVSADLNWTQGGIEVLWDVEWGPQGFVLGSANLDDNLAVTTDPLTGLTPGTDYHWYVRAVCDVNTTDGVDTVSFYVGPLSFTTTNPSACADPSALDVNNITPTSADLSWTPGGIETEWNVQWGEDGFTLSGTGANLITNVTTIPLDLTGLTPNTDYEFYVQSVCGGSESNWVGPYSWSTFIACPQPTTLNAINITHTAANLLWQPSGSETSWELEWGMPGFMAGNGEEAGSATATAFPYYVTGLNETAPYWFYVRANCGGSEGDSDWAGPYAFNTLMTNNDACDAMSITVGAPMIQHYSTGATSQAGEPTVPGTGSCVSQNGWCAPANNTSTWFKFVAPSTGAAEITTFSEEMTSTYTQIAIYAVAICGNFASYELIAANTNDPASFGPPFGSTVQACGLTSGQTYYVEVDNISGWGTGNFGIEVSSVDPNISAGTALNADVCENSGSFDLFMTITGNSTTNGTWYNPTPAPGNELPNVVDLTGVPAGTYAFYYVDGSVCGSDTVMSFVTIEEAAQVGSDNTVTLCNNGKVDLLDQILGFPQGGGTWSDDDNSGALENGVFDAEMFEAGTYSFTYTVDNGGACPAASSTVTVILEDCVGLGVEDNNVSQLSVFPNPVSDVLTINNLNIVNGTLTIYDVQGKEIRTINVGNFTGNYLLDMSTLERGVYVVRVATADSVQEVRVVKQ